MKNTTWTQYQTDEIKSIDHSDCDCIDAQKQTICNIYKYDIKIHFPKISQDSKEFLTLSYPWLATLFKILK